MNEQFATSPRKVAFKRVITDYLREHGSATKQELVAAAKREVPELCDDDEPCSPGCMTNHPKWRHQFDRAVYDLTSSIPPKIRGDGGRPNVYRLGFRGGAAR